MIKNRTYFFRFIDQQNNDGSYTYGFQVFFLFMKYNVVSNIIYPYTYEPFSDIRSRVTKYFFLEIVI